MVSTVSNTRWKNMVSETTWDVTAAWNRAIKRTIARFVRGNIAAQHFRITLPEEQKKQHERARHIAEKWRDRR